MFSQILALTWKDLKIFFKDRRAMMVIFAQPFMFILVMSYALSGMFNTGDQPMRILAVNGDRGQVAESILDQLGAMKAFKVETAWNGQPLTTETADRLVADRTVSLALIFPANFSDLLGRADRQGAAKVAVVADPATSSLLVDPMIGTLQGLIERTAFMSLIPQDAASSPATIAVPVSDVQTTGVTVERVAPAGMKVQQTPTTFQQNVPGYTIYGVFWIVSLLASSVLLEKHEGTFRRLLVSPMRQSALLAGKLLPYFLINVLQVAIMIGVSAVLFHMSLGASPAGLVAISLAACAAATGLGVLVAALARSEAQVGGMAMLLVLTMSAVGGCFVPRFVMPEWLRTIGLVTPHAWALDGFQDLLVRNYGFVDVLPKVGVLAAFAVVFFGIGVWRFRFEQ